MIEKMKLGHKNLVANKRRSIMLIVVMGVLLSVIVALNLLVEGLREKSLQLGNAREDGKVLLWTALNNNFVELPEGYVEGTPIEVESRNLTMRERAEIEERIRKFGGEIVEAPKLLTYGEGDEEKQWLVMPSKLMGRALEMPLDEVPDDVVPIFLPVAVASYNFEMVVPVRGKDLLQRRLETLKGILAKGMGKEVELSYDEDRKFYVVGMAPSALTSMEIPGDSLNPLNLILAIAPSAAGSQVMLVDDGSNKVEKLWPEGNLEVMDGVMALFPDEEAAYGYATMKDNANSYTGYSSQKYTVQEYLNNALGVAVTYRAINFLVGILSIVLIAVALVVILFTVVRVIKQETRNAALYRALGATKGEVKQIYLWYVLELCAWTVVFALVVGVILVLVVCGINQGALVSVFSTAYGQVLAGPVILLGWTTKLLGIAGVVFLIAPICILLTSGQFKDKKLMAKLKTT